jgi:dihydroxyacetone kinase-like predicted kinase
MHLQTEEREQRLLQAVPHSDNRTDVIAVVAGDGNRRLFESLGAAQTVDGGQTMNPATAELAAAVSATGAPEAVLLPNNPNVILAAEQAAALAGKPVRVIPTRSLQAGLAAMVAFDGTRAADENEAAMRETAERVATGAVTVASRDVRVNGSPVAQGSYLGLLEGEPQVGGSSFDDVARAVVERLLAEPRDVLTILTGAEHPQIGALVEELRELHPELEIEVQEGGQPHYSLLLSAE